MKHRRPRASLAQRAALAAVVAVVVAGCGEVKNTITPPPYSANTVTVVLPGQPDAFYVGLYEAEALGLFKQSDLNVRVVVPAAGQDPVTMVHDQQALVGISSEPNVLLHRNIDQPVVAVAAIVHAPLQAITITVPRGGPSGGVSVGTGTTVTRSTTTRATRTTTTTRTTKRTRRARKPRHTTTRATTATTPTTATAPTTTTVAEPDAALWPAQLQQLLGAAGYSTYNGLVVVVRKESIVDDAPLVRRFVQALARGYRAARANRAQAITNLIAAVPALAPQKALETATLRAAIPYFFPSGLKVWGYQKQSEWNSFGTWLSQHQLLSNPNAVTDAITNELLPGQGV
ncbi:MAG: ABC transporter substrate-binding protein [Acidobacteriota bacterium]|nr:ABC transporter substrate-binding protein [Acidobacteriota bacterium]